jgi:hypothetical protein
MYHLHDDPPDKDTLPEKVAYWFEHKNMIGADTLCVLIHTSIAPNKSPNKDYNLW